MPLERKPLFRPDVLRPRLQAFDLPRRVSDHRHLITKWADLLKAPDADRLKEQELLGDFLTDIFVTLLGYARPADSPQRYTISREQHVEAFGKFADGVLGEFTPADRRFVVAIEGKGPTDPLDRPFKSRALSAVDQGYRYAINLPCDWIIVTSMRNTRLYSKGSDQLTYEVFPIADLATNDHLLKKFVFLLGAERVVPAAGRCHLDILREASDKAGRELTRDFYQRYANMREDVFEQLCAHNPQHSRHDVLSATQHLLDRVLFCAFCEDRGLLPEETLTHAFSHRDPYNPRPVWENFRGLFRAINVGNPELRIPPYNGGLFAEDPIADAVTVPDAVCVHFKELGEYDYRAASDALDDPDRKPRGALVDVDILGHIFEQSISDLEQIRNELDGLVPAQGKDKHKTRRKKEGAFYTPAFITRYIVEQTLGQVLADRFEQLRSDHQSRAKGAAAKSLADPRVYDRDALKKPEREALIEFWEAWQEELSTIRVLDPACGSGAFLIEAFDHLYAEYQRANDRLTEIRKQQPSLFYPDARILQHNLYGVDLNEEAIQICRLSLWIKTAHPSRPLTTLDHTIRVGNSVVDDPAVHPRAFDWQRAFPEVTQAGGFDVVIGNPPYIRQEWLKAYKPYWETRFPQVYAGTADIYVYFYAAGIERLRRGGRLAFVSSNAFARANYAENFRRFISQERLLREFVDLGDSQVFEDAKDVYPAIVVMEKPTASATDLPEVRTIRIRRADDPTAIKELVASRGWTVPAGRVTANGWQFDEPSTIALREKLLAHHSVAEYAGSKMFRGIVTGSNEVFVIDGATRQSLIHADPRSDELIKPWLRGEDIRRWYAERTELWVIFTRRGVPIDSYPAIHSYLTIHRDRLEPRPADWSGGAWPGRKPGPYKWYEIQDSIDYWQSFAAPKIMWPDIAKSNRFMMDTGGFFSGNTTYCVGGEDWYLLALLNSRSTWFALSGISIPFGERAGEYRYRLFTQYVSKLPIPAASDSDRDSLAGLAQRCNTLAPRRYDLQTQVQRRLVQTFAEDVTTPSAKLNTQAQEWWEHSLTQLGAALKASFKLKDNPFKNPSLADAWEPYLTEKKAEVARLTRELSDAETELNDRVYRLFDLTPEEIKLLQREVEH